MDKRVSLITTIFSDDNEVGIVKGLSRGDAQAFIDTIDEVCFCTVSPPNNLLPLKLPHLVG